MTFKETVSSFSTLKKDEEPQELKKTVEQIAVTLTDMTLALRQEGENQKHEIEARMEVALKAVQKWEKALSIRLQESNEVLVLMEESSKKLRRSRLWFALSMLAGWMSGLILLILCLRLPTINALLYRLILMFGR